MVVMTQREELVQNRKHFWFRSSFNGFLEPLSFFMNRLIHLRIMFLAFPLYSCNAVYTEMATLILSPLHQILYVYIMHIFQHTHTTPHNCFVELSDWRIGNNGYTSTLLRRHCRSFLPIMLIIAPFIAIILSTNIRLKILCKVYAVDQTNKILFLTQILVCDQYGKVNSWFRDRWSMSGLIATMNRFELSNSQWFISWNCCTVNWSLS